MDFPHYSQGDQRWSRRILGKNRTIKQAGCAVTACSMLVSGLTGKKLTPDLVDGYLDRSGGYSTDSIRWNKICKYAKIHKVKLGNVEFQYIKRPSEVSNRSPFPYVMRVRYDYKKGYHYVLLLDANGNIHDPATRKGEFINMNDTHYLCSRITHYPRQRMVISMYDAQRELYELGHYRYRVDGIYGRHTRTALLEFQCGMSIPETGILDDLTSSILADMKAGVI